jgi:hypothetical protein
MFEKSDGPKWPNRLIALFTIVVGVTTFALGQTNADDDITGTVSKAEPLNKQDGTPAHPYSDASHCPATTDIIIWPKTDHPIPSIPPGISVCFVGDESFNSSGPEQVKIRD